MTSSLAGQLGKGSDRVIWVIKFGFYFKIKRKLSRSNSGEERTKQVWKRTKLQAEDQQEGRVNNPGKKWWQFGLRQWPWKWGEREKSLHSLEVELVKLSDRLAVVGIQDKSQISGLGK